MRLAIPDRVRDDTIRMLRPHFDGSPSAPEAQGAGLAPTLRRLVGFVVLTTVLAAAPEGRGQAADSLAAPDSLVLTVPPDSQIGPSPRGALLRSLAVPGWGQVYAGQPAKAPFAAAGVAGLVGLTVYLNGRYVRYRHAYLYVSREDDDPTVPDADNEFAGFFDDWVEAGSQSASANRARRDVARRNRDLAVLGTVVVYALQALDAYVAAELTGFDVSEDLSLRVAPAPGGAAAVLSLRL